MSMGHVSTHQLGIADLIRVERKNRAWAPAHIFFFFHPRVKSTITFSTSSNLGSLLSTMGKSFLHASACHFNGTSSEACYLYCMQDLIGPVIT